MSRNNGGAQRRARNRLQRDGEHTTTCMWCGETIYWLNMIPPQNIIKVSHSHITVQINGYQKMLLVATVDHYFELRNGGTNELRNLIPSCAICNRDRSAQPKIRPDTCVQCGGKKKGGGRRRCQKCCNANRPLYDPYFQVPLSIS
jgi:hypothetical protein